MPYKGDPQAQMSTAMTMDMFSPWTQMLLAEQGGYTNPPPFVPVPVPVPVPQPGASSESVDPAPRPRTSSESVDPDPSSAAELLRRLEAPSNQGWRKGYGQ